MLRLALCRCVPDTPKCVPRPECVPPRPASRRLAHDSGDLPASPTASPRVPVGTASPRPPFFTGGRGTHPRTDAPRSARR